MPSPAVVRTPNGDQLTFCRGVDAALWSMRNGDGWVRIGGTLTSGPGAAMLGDVVHVFAVGSTRELFHTFAPADRATDAAAFAGWENLGGLLTSAPSVAAVGGRLDVVARGGDGQPYQLAWLGDHWTSWWPLGGMT